MERGRRGGGVKEGGEKERREEDGEGLQTADNLQKLPFTLRLFGYCTRCLAFLLGSAVGGGSASEVV